MDVHDRSGNAATQSAGGILSFNNPVLRLVNNTLAANAASSASGKAILSEFGDLLEVAGTVIDGDCSTSTPPRSNGHNIESPGNTCGFDQTTDQVNVTAEQLNLQPLANNGGPTMTHALGAGSVAIDQIPEEDCGDADGLPLTEDQRGFPRDSMCDVGAFEAQP